MRKPAKSAGKVVKASPSAPDTPDMTLDEVLEQMLPHCSGNPFEVAKWLGDHVELGEVRLLADGIFVPPHLYSTHLRMVAQVAPDGRAGISVELMRGFGLGEKGTVPIKQWTVERKSFEENRPGAPRNLGGRDREVDRERLLREALIYSVVYGWPDHLDGDGGLFDKLGARVKNLPARTTLYEIFTPVVDGIKDERSKLAKKPKAPT
jgi:hypothetical protein